MLGGLNTSIDSSSFDFSYVVIATLSSVSNPMMSAVLNVALFGLPHIAPVKKSTSSILIFLMILNLIADIKLNIPTLLPIKFGLSLAGTIPLFNIDLQKLVNEL